MGKKEVAIFVLIILLIIALGYIGVLKYREREFGIYQQGMSEGYTGAVTQIINQASTCQAFPVYANNITLNLIAVECLQQAQGQGNSSK